MRKCHTNCISLILSLALQLSTAYSQPQMNTYPNHWDDLLRDVEARPDTHQLTRLLSVADTAVVRYFYGRKTNNLDIVERILTSISTLSAQLNDQHSFNKCLLLQSRLLHIQQKNAAADTLYKKAMVYYLKAPEAERAEAFYLLSRSWRFRISGWEIRHADSTHFLQALKYYRSAGDKYREASLQGAIGYIYAMSNNLSAAIGTFLDLYKLQTTIHDNTRQRTCDMLAHCYAVTGKFPEAMNYAIQSLNIAREVNDTTGYYACYYRLGRISCDLKELEKGVYYLRLALQHADLQGDTAQIIHATCSLCIEGLLPSGKYQAVQHTIIKTIEKYPITSSKDFHQASDLLYCLGTNAYYTGQYQVAEKYFLQVLDIVEKNSEDLSGRIPIYSTIGSLYLSDKKMEKAAYYFNKALNIAGQTNSPSPAKDIHFKLYQIDSANGNYRSAINHYLAYKQLTDSIFDVAKSKQLAELEIRYDTREKEKELQLLNKQSQLQQAAIRQSRVFRNMMIAGAMLLVVLLGLVYSRYRIKQKSNRLLQERQQEIDARNDELMQLNRQQQQLLGEKGWLMREIHHRVKNNLQIILSLLNIQTEDLKDASALTAIGEASSRVRAISLIHQKLYQENVDMTTVSMPEYITELVGFLRDSFQWGEGIHFRLDIIPITLGVSQCVPIGLILNEAITNSIKYAFPWIVKKQGQPGPPGPVPGISVALRHTSNDWLELVVADNGKGLPSQFDIDQCTSMGMELIRTLCEQLNGTMILDNRKGLSISIRFPIEKELTEFSIPA